MTVAIQSKPMTGQTRTTQLYRADMYGESFADVYDDWYHDVSDPKASADFVNQRCGGGTVLEVGVGSGRLARPLAEQGLTVVGVDASNLMLKKAAKRPRPHIELIQGDMRNLPLNPRSRFDGILIGFNTFFNVNTEKEQRQLMKDLAAVMAPSGSLVIEASTSPFAELPLADDQVHSFGADRRQGNSVIVTSTDVDRKSQKIDGCHIQVGDESVTFRPWQVRLVSHQQLDSYASAANLVLTERYADWDYSPFSTNNTNNTNNTKHVSVYRHDSPVN